jgi:N-acetylneuraminic acid mutarotase
MSLSKERGVEEVAKELDPKSYEPAARGGHISFPIKGKLYVWGGVTHDDDGSSVLANSIEQFDPYFEVWSRLNTEGTPHPGQNGAANALLGDQMYTYGGSQDIFGKDIMYTGVLSSLDLDTLTWSLLCPAGIVGAPMRKTGCGMVHLSQDKLAVIGGYGIPTGPIQLGSSFIKHTRLIDGRGWTNEIHLFDLNRGTNHSS